MLHTLLLGVFIGTLTATLQTYHAMIVLAFLGVLFLLAVIVGVMISKG